MLCNAVPSGCATKVFDSEVVVVDDIPIILLIIHLNPRIRIALDTQKCSTSIVQESNIIHHLTYIHHTNKVSTPLHHLAAHRTSFIPKSSDENEPSMTLLPSAFHFTTPGPSSSPIPPPGTHLIISDTPGASSDFCVYSLVASCVRERVKVTIVDFGSRGRLHWEGVGKKIVSTSCFLHLFFFPAVDGSRMSLGGRSRAPHFHRNRPLYYVTSHPARTRCSTHPPTNPP